MKKNFFSLKTIVNNEKKLTYDLTEKYVWHYPILFETNGVKLSLENSFSSKIFCMSEIGNVCVVKEEKITYFKKRFCALCAVCWRKNMNFRYLPLITWNMVIFVSFPIVLINCKFCLCDKSCCFSNSWQCNFWFKSECEVALLCGSKSWNFDSFIYLLLRLLMMESLFLTSFFLIAFLNEISLLILLLAHFLKV